MRLTITSASAIAVLVAALVLCGCAIAGTGGGTAAAPSVTATRTVAPGITEWTSGTVEAAGYVMWLDLEGGFWALRDGPAVVAGVKEPKVVAVLLPSAVGESQIAAFNGAYVVAGGRIQGGASIRMAGPELMVDTIAPAVPPKD